MDVPTILKLSLNSILLRTPPAIAPSPCKGEDLPKAEFFITINQRHFLLLRI